MPTSRLVQPQLPWRHGWCTSLTMLMSMVILIMTTIMPWYYREIHSCPIPHCDNVTGGLTTTDAE